MRRAEYIGVIAAVVSAVVALGTWLFPLEKPSNNQHEANPSREQVAAQLEQLPEGKAAEQTPREAKAEEPDPRLAVREEDPVANIKKVNTEREEVHVRSFGLGDGDQKVLCSGLAGIAADFTTVSGVDLLTLRLNSGDESTYHAVLGAGERLKFRCKEKDTYISVTSLDLVEQRVALQVD